MVFYRFIFTFFVFLLWLMVHASSSAAAASSSSAACVEDRAIFCHHPFFRVFIQNKNFMNLFSNTHSCYCSLFVCPNVVVVYSNMWCENCKMPNPTGVTSRVLSFSPISVSISCYLINILCTCNVVPKAACLQSVARGFTFLYLLRRPNTTKKRERVLFTWEACMADEWMYDVVVAC